MRVTTRHMTPFALGQLKEIRHGTLHPSAVAAPLRRTFQDLGGTFTKFGQLIASSHGLFGDAIADEFRSCLDTGPLVPVAEVQQRIEEDLGMDLEEAFVEFDPIPVGQASIAVVHRAVLTDGTEVAVKVLRPGIERLVATDIQLMLPLFELLTRLTGEQIAGSTLQVLDGFQVQIGEELDLRNEARTMARFRELFAERGFDRLVVPKPYPELSGPNVVTMEMLHGVPVDDLASAAERGVDPAPLVEEVLRAFFVTIVRWAAFHGDLHAGNMLLLDDGRLGIVDWGIVGRLDQRTHRFFVRLIQAVLGDEAAWDDVTQFLVDSYGPILQEGMGLRGPALTAFVRGVVEPTLTRPFGEVSLAEVIAAPQAQAARAAGIQAHKLSVGSILGRLRAQRRLQRLAEGTGYVSSDFDRGTFLLGKQLLYFERYGKLVMPEAPLLGDKQFFAEVLAEAFQ